MRPFCHFRSASRKTTTTTTRNAEDNEDVVARPPASQTDRTRQTVKQSGVVCMSWQNNDIHILSLSLSSQVSRIRFPRAVCFRKMDTAWTTAVAVIALFLQVTTAILSNNRSINTNNNNRRQLVSASANDDNVRVFNVSASYVTTSLHSDVDEDNGGTDVDAFPFNGTTPTSWSGDSGTSMAVAPITDSDLQFLRELPVDKLLRIRKTVRFVSHMMTDAWPMADTPDGRDSSIAPNCTKNAKHKQQQHFCSGDTPQQAGQRRTSATAEQTGPEAATTAERQAVNVDGYLMELPALQQQQLQQSTPLDLHLQYRQQQQQLQQQQNGADIMALAHASPLTMEQIKCVWL